MAPDVLAICVNWNGREVLAETLEALLRSTYRRLQIVVVDNDSNDGSTELVPPGIEILRAPGNRGYGGAVNLLWREMAAGSRARPAYHLLINNDVLLEEDAVTRLVDFAERTGPGVFGPKVLCRQSPERLDMAWGYLRWNHVLARFLGKGAPDGPAWEETRSVELLQGSVLLIHDQVVSAIGLFDEAFFMYHEEVDFLYRARLAGYPAWYCPCARALHWGAYSTRSSPLRKVFWTRRNTVYFMRKHRASVWNWCRFVLTLCASLFFNVGLFRWRRAGIILQAVLAGCRMPVMSTGSNR